MLGTISDEARDIFGECGACLGNNFAPGPTLKKALCNNRPFGGTCDTASISK